MIRVDHLTRSFGPTVAIDGLTFSVDRGEVVGFLGPNGAGKSTTMRILTGFLAADSGTAELAGIDVAADPVGVRRRVGYLPESNPLYSDMTASSFLDFAATVRGVERSKRRASIDRVASACGLRHVMQRSISELSKGYRQRVGLAQALLHDPDLLILDEPTSGLDPNQVLEIRELIRNLGREKTVLLSTHILQEVTAVCGRALILARGRMVADGPPLKLARTDGPVRVMCSGVALEEAESAIAAVAGVTVTSKAAIDGRLRFDLIAPGGEETCERVASALAARGARLSELHRVNETLEECFHRLTVGDGSARA